MIKKARESNISPNYFLFPLILTINLAFMLPVATPTNAIVFSNGYVKMRDMVIKIISIFLLFFISLSCLYSIIINLR